LSASIAFRVGDELAGSSMQASKQIMLQVEVPNDNASAPLPWTCTG